MLFSGLNVKKKRTEHVHLAVGKIDDVHDAQDEGKADPDERIGAPDEQPVDEILQENGHETRLIEKKRLIPRLRAARKDGGSDRGRR